MIVAAEVLVGLILLVGVVVTIWFLAGYDGSGPW